MSNNPAFAAIAAQEAAFHPTEHERDLQANSYYWFAAEDIPFLYVPLGRIDRCRVVPVTRKLIWDSVDMIPMEMREAGFLRDPDPISRKPTMCAYALKPGDIGKWIEGDYASWGLVELTPLRGWEPRKVEELGLDGLFFPERHGWIDVQQEGGRSVPMYVDEIPRTYREIQDRIREVAGKVKNGEIAVVNKDVILRCAEVMLRSIPVCRAWDQAALDGTHAEMERAKTDRNAKAVYDGRDLRALIRLEQTRRDEAIAHLAGEHNTLQAAVSELIKAHQPTNYVELGVAIAQALKEADKANKPDHTKK